MMHTELIETRGEISELESLALRLAESHRSSGLASRKGGQGTALIQYLDEFAALLKEAVFRFQGATSQHLAISYATEWVLDNHYIAARALREIGEDLPPKFYRQLPKLSAGTLEGYPRVYALAREIIGYEAALLDLDRVGHFIHTYQSVTPLTMGELWALPIMLRLGIIERLVLAVSRITGIQAKLEGYPIEGLEPSGEPTDEETVANSFLSLRTIAAQDWKVFFEDLSQVEQVLRREPAGLYAGMDFETRDRYRKVVEEIALAAGMDELRVAREAVRLAQSDLDRREVPISQIAVPIPTDGYYRSAERDLDKISQQLAWDEFTIRRASHVGYYLLDHGRSHLETSLGFQPGWLQTGLRWIRAHPTLFYLGSIGTLSALITLALMVYTLRSGGTALQLILAGLLVIIPAMTIAVNLVNWVITSTVKPRVLPKMDFEARIPPECSTLVVIPALTTDPEEVESLLRQLELHYLRNPYQHLYFALLTDLVDASQEHLPEDDVLVEQAKAGIQSLNTKYGREKVGPFFLFHRERRWNPREKRWMGWERKRGKLHELNQLILGSQESSFSVQIGNLEALRKIRYVITLDADTLLPRESARRLIEAFAHPLNRAEFDQENRVTAGYSVLQPRTEINPTSANQSLFTRIFSGDTGLDLYTLAVSDVYQDLFGEGIYVGKGIYDVQAFERSLAGVVPDNALLSHDLFEGIHGRAALVTDIVLIEDFPPHYLVHISRLHRWVRGDWQLLPWLFPRVPSNSGEMIRNRLPVIDRWKIFDNLRRSLVSPVLMLLVMLSWLWLPGSPWIWTLFGVASLAVPVFTRFIGALGDLARGLSFRQVLGSVGEDLRRWLLALVFLPYEALVTLNAIVTTLIRLYVTRRHLLKWTTAAQSVRRYEEGVKPNLTWRQMVIAFLLASILFLALWLLRPEVLLPASPLLLLWLLSPEIAYWISRPIPRKRPDLDEDEWQRLHNLARHTWLFFEQFMGPEDHWLPPDHYQEAPLGVVAHRTSPTNVGMALLSTLGAYDLGYIGPLDLAARLQATFETLDQLERHRGHFYNWYDTRSLEILEPRYISTVDSGNLAAGFITLGQGCLEVPETQILRWESWQGFLDLLALFVELLESLEEKEARSRAARLKNLLTRILLRVLGARERPETWITLLNQLVGEGVKDRWMEVDHELMEFVETSAALVGAEDLRRLRILSSRLHQHLSNQRREVEILLPWLLRASSPPALFGQPDLHPAIQGAWQDFLSITSIYPKLSEVDAVAREARLRLEALQQQIESAGQPSPLAEEACNWCQDLRWQIDSAAMAAKVLVIGYHEYARQTGAYVRAMEFDFLFDRQRQVFHIGYNATTGKLDGNYYDLLASEARIASLVAIAKGDVPQSHWLHLSRPFTRVDSTRALLSWSATMFEYLMPMLWVKSYPGTLLHQSSEAAVDWQMEYAAQKKIPWGISESGYYRFDANQFYQYRAFGVPGLGYKRGLGDDLVVTPYASLLALPLRPKAVLENLDRLTGLGMRGTYGYYEAIDFTPSRLMLGDPYAIVCSYMAHHQGMILVSLANFLKGEVMVRRFHADPRIQSLELLLQEQIPQLVPIEQPHAEDGPAFQPILPSVTSNPWQVPVQAPQPRAHFLSNGRYGVMITSSGGGYSAWKETDLTRWRADPTLNNWGLWIYVQNQDSGALWSAGSQPTGAQPDTQEVFFNAHMVEFRRRDQDISLAMEITVAPEDDAEVRRITLTNHSEHTRRLRVVSYAEVALAPQPTDARHPAFNKLFIESEFQPEANALLFRRRPRSAEEDPVFLAHFVTLEEERPRGRAGLSYESDRVRFLGRGHTTRFPVVLRGASRSNRLSGTAGATLDPIMAISQEVELRPHSSLQLAYVTVAAPSRQELLTLASRYRVWSTVGRAFDQARSQAEVELRHLGIKTEHLERYQTLLSLMFYPHAALRAEPAVLVENRKGQPALWAYRISGDYPIMLVRVSRAEELPLVHELLQAHIYWRKRNLRVDLVILNTMGTGYEQELNNQIRRLLTLLDSEGWLNQRGGIFLLVADQMVESDRLLLESAARAILDGERGSLAEQLQRCEALHRLPTRLPPFMPSAPETEKMEPTPPVARPADLQFDNGLGGFSADGKEYVIYLAPGQWTPAPWSNVIANPEFGFLVTESGGGYTWSVNSGENRLTPWSNDPVSDLPGESLYLRDEETAKVWSPTPLPARTQAPYLVRHGAGYSIFEHHSHGLKQRLKVFAALDAPVKFIQLRLENTWSRARRITATYYAEWVLGVNREQAQQYLVPDFDGESQTLLARNPYNPEFGERVAFAAASQPLHGLTADRTEFLGRMGQTSRPAALRRIGLSGTVTPGVDPCAALMLHIDLQPGEVAEVYFLLGQGSDREEAVGLARQYQQPEQVASAWKAVEEFWDEFLGTVAVDTPEPAMDLLLNRWLLYQSLSCRIWGRSAFYQSSGAYGFRDQLQDVMSLQHAAPALTREHLLRAARNQFEAGDVLHWWHPPSGRGVRTRISDDLLWLPYVTAEYVEATGDESVLQEKVPFLRAPLLEPEEEDRYGLYPHTPEAYSLYEHCRRALEKGTTSGRHRLPLIGSGDWNDGMNRVGIEGRGESVWLGWFLYATLLRFIELCERRGDQELAAWYRQRAADLQAALEAHGWDGEWYLRAYYDDGSLLGSARNRECQIDAIAQSWAVLSTAGDLQRSQRAMQSFSERLVRPDDRLLLLFTPPFDKTPRDPGYIKGYLPGTRENGGQYTHAAIWSVWAFARLGQGDYAEELFRLLNPIYHADHPEKAARYKVEPYVVAADVYSVPPHVGRGGWTWYTGSSGWLYRLGLEAILGLRREGQFLVLDPCIPKHWPGYGIRYRSGKDVYEIRVENPQGANRGVREVRLDGEVLSDGIIPIQGDGGQHRVEVIMG